MSKWKQTDTLISNIDNVYLSASRCLFHAQRSCITIFNNFNQKRFHCLYANASLIWKKYGIGSSCDLPEYFHDVIVIGQELSPRYVFPFSSHFRERTGFTIGMFWMDREVYGPPIVKPDGFKYTVTSFIVLLCAICHRFGGIVPNLRRSSFVYDVSGHPILTDVGSSNAEKRERMGATEYFNAKKWMRFLRRKTIRDVVRYTRINFPQFFKKKAVRGSKCILADGFDDETHQLICKSGKLPIIQVLEQFHHLIVDDAVREKVVPKWMEEGAPQREEF